MSTRMVRLLLSLCAVFALTLLVACESSSDNKAKGTVVAVVNQEIVYRESQAAKAAVAHLDSVSDTLRAEVTQLQAAVQNYKDAAKGQSELEASLAEMQQRFAAEQQQVTVKVTALFDKAQETCRQAAGATVIISSDLVLSYDKSVDLTDKILEEMNKTPMTFTRLGEEPEAGAASTNGTMPATNGTEKAPAPNATNSTN